MDTKELILKRKSDFNTTICLSAIIPILVFIYLLTVKVATLDILKGEVGIILLNTVIVFLFGLAAGKHLLRNMLNELIEKERLKTITATALTLGHEINNPLLIISGNLELIENDALPKEAKERVEAIKSNFARIQQCMEKIVSLKKAATEEISSSIKMIDLSKSV